MQEKEKNEYAARVRELNDRFRRAGVAGEVVVTRGVVEMGHRFTRAALNAVQEFDTFTEDNDPYHEHDFGSFQLEGHTLFWKMDYYDARDPEPLYGSPNPADPAVTYRVLTVMLAEEY